LGNEHSKWLINFSGVQKNFWKYRDKMNFEMFGIFDNFCFGTPTWTGLHSLCTPCLKSSQICFCHNFIKFPQTVKIFGTNMPKTIELCKVHSFTTSANLRQRTTV